MKVGKVRCVTLQTFCREFGLSESWWGLQLRLGRFPYPAFKYRRHWHLPEASVRLFLQDHQNHRKIGELRGYLTTREAAREFGVSVQYMTRMARQGSRWLHGVRYHRAFGDSGHQYHWNPLELAIAARRFRLARFGHTLRGGA